LVPVLLYVPGELGDCMRFGETFAAKGSLGKFSSNRLFNVLQKLLLFD
jgi:2,3-bisphosphoglycerate-independent phosphoglycerate mutase